MPSTDTSVNSNTIRSRRRREKLQQEGLTEIRAEVTAAEKNRFKRISKQAGYKSLTACVRGLFNEKAEELGVSGEQENNNSNAK